MQKLYYTYAGKYLQIVKHKPISEYAKGRGGRKSSTEEKAADAERKSGKLFELLVIGNFGKGDLFVTLTYGSGKEPPSYDAAVKKLENFFRRIKYKYPYAVLIGITARGKNCGRLHHHALIKGITSKQAEACWKCGFSDVRSIESQQEQRGELDTMRKISAYMFGQIPADRKTGAGRWRSRNVISPREEKPTKLSETEAAAFTRSHAPDIGGYVWIETKVNECSGDITYYYVRSCGKNANKVHFRACSGSDDIFHTLPYTNGCVKPFSRFF